MAGAGIKKHEKSTTRFAWFNLAAWTFVGAELARGALQAVGGLFIYAFAIWLVVSNVLTDGQKNAIRNAIAFRTSVIATSSSTTSPASTPTSTSNAQNNKQL